VWAGNFILDTVSSRSSSFLFSNIILCGESPTRGEVSRSLVPGLYVCIVLLFKGNKNIERYILLWSNKCQCNYRLYIQSLDNLMYTYNSLKRSFNKKVTEYSLENKGLTVRSREILHKRRRIILIESTKIRWFSRWSGGGGWSFLLEAKNLKTTQVRSSGSSPLR
jgi:hypothetical protein